MEAAMDEQANQAQAEAQPPAEEPQPQSRGGEEEEEEEPRNEDEELIAKAQKLMQKITSSPENLSPLVLHTFASLLETQESKYRFFFLLFCVLISIRIWADWWVMI